MIRLSPQHLPAVSRWFDTGAPGSAALAEHVAATGVGAWWGDRALSPRTVAVSCAGHVLLSGDPGTLSPALLAPFAHSRVEAPDRFLPLLDAAFDRVVPAERLVYVYREPVAAPRPPRGVTVRRLEPGDAPALAALSPASAWIHSSWGGPQGLAASGHGWAAFDRSGRVATVACGYFVGNTYERLAVLTPTEHRNERLALACVASLCADIGARGRVASWSFGRGDRIGRLLAWTAGFRLEHEYARHITGGAAAQPRTPPRVSA